MLGDRLKNSKKRLLPQNQNQNQNNNQNNNQKYNNNTN